MNLGVGVRRIGRTSSVSVELRTSALGTIMLRPQTLRQYGALLNGVSHAMGRHVSQQGVHPMHLTLVHSRSLHASSVMQRASRLGQSKSAIAALRSNRSFKFAHATAATQHVWMSSSAPAPLQKDDEEKKEVVDAFKLEKDTWAERHAPKWMVPYIQLARLNRPAGTYMLLWPCFWSISLAAPAGQFPDLGMLALFGTGALIMRSAGCTINDMWDKDFDKKVERTNQRPLASGALTYPQAWKFLALQLSAGLGVLLQLNWYSIVLGASSMALVISYPLMKRVTYWPQAVLGLTFNYGALLGWSAVQGTCVWPIVLPMYAGGVAWTLVYDTLYAHQDKKDDQHIGVRSTALLFGDNTKPILNAFSAVTIAGLGTAGYLAGLDWPFYAGLAGGAAHLAWQVNTAKLDDPINLQTRFNSNKWFGALMWASIVAGKVL